MLLPLDQSKYFLDSYMQLICRITGDEPSTPKEWARSRDKMLDVIRNDKVSKRISKESFYQEVSRFVSGQFVYLKRYKNHYAMMHIASSKFYAVYALTSQLDEMIPEYCVVDTCLIPHEGVIVCDGLLTDSNVRLGMNYT